MKKEKHYMIILQICAFAAPMPGNFIPALLELENALKEHGTTTIYAFPERARDKQWCKEIQTRTKVYFLPEAQARLRLQTYLIMRNIYSENDVDIVHSHFELYDIPATLMAPKRVKVFWHLHDALKENYQKSAASRRILTKIQYGYFGKRAKLLSVSKEHAQFAIELGFHKKNVEYLPNGINTFRIRTEQIDKSMHRKKLLLFGWEVYRKGVDLVVEAAKKINDNEVHIRVVGQEACDKYLKMVGAPSIIRYSKPVEDVNELYRETSVFLHISRAEGLSYALLEAIYAGLPIICSDIPENQFANQFRNIVWIKNEDVDELAEAINSIQYIVSDIREEDIQFNRDLIQEHYALNNWVERVITYYLT